MPGDMAIESTGRLLEPTMDPRPEDRREGPERAVGEAEPRKDCRTPEVAFGPC